MGCAYVAMVLSISWLKHRFERDIIPMFREGNGRFSADATRPAGYKSYKSFLHLCTFYIMVGQCIQRACCQPR